MYKNIHLIWISRKKEAIPAMCARFVDLWEEIYTGWGVRVWGNADIPTLNDPVLDAAWGDTRICEAQVSNRMRLAIVNQFGGIYADIDTKPIKSLEPVIESNQEKLIVGVMQGLTKLGNRTVDLNMFYSRPGNPIISECLEKFPVQERGNGSINDFVANSGSPDVLFLPWGCFHSLKLTGDCYTLHWPHRMGTWLRK